MIAETLRHAAAKIRADLCYSGSGHEFYAAVADMLDGAAALAFTHELLGNHGDGCPVCGPIGRALAVARAYLGEPA